MADGVDRAIRRAHRRRAWRALRRRWRWIDTRVSRLIVWVGARWWRLGVLAILDAAIIVPTVWRP